MRLVAKPDNRFSLDEDHYLELCPYTDGFNTVNPEIFARILFIANSVKSHFCQVKNLRLCRDLPTSVNDKEFSPFRKGFIFVKLRICKVSRK